MAVCLRVCGVTPLRPELETAVLNARFTFPIGAAELNIGDDGVGEFTPPRTGGFAFITCGGTSSSVFPSHNFSALIWYDTGGSLTCQKGPAWGSVGQDVDVTISDLTGTSGVDGRVTIAARAGKLKVENRIGAAKTFSVSFL